MKDGDGMRSRTVAALAVTGVIAGALFMATTRSPQEDFSMDFFSWSHSGPVSFLDKSGSAYIIDGVYLGYAKADNVVGEYLTVDLEVEKAEFLGDDSPDTLGQTPPPQLDTGDRISVTLRKFDISTTLTPGDVVVVMVSHDSNFDPPWITSAIALHSDRDFAMIGANAAPLAEELSVAADTLNMSREDAFRAIARELFSSDVAMRDGASREDSLGPALQAADTARQAAIAAASPEAMWEAADPTERGLQRMAAPDSLLDTLPEMDAVYNISEEFIKAYPDALVELRNKLGVTSSVAADLGEAGDTIYGDPASAFEVTYRTQYEAPATVLASLAPSAWQDQYAVLVDVFMAADGTPTASITPATLEEFKAAIEEQGKNIGFETPEEAEESGR
jgi:hypothetical protein